MKRPRRGSSWLRLTPGELLAKLATLIPPPRVHGVRYHGVFAPHSRMRVRVVPQADADARPAPPPPASSPPPRRSYRVPWAELLRKVFAVDVLACPDCDGRLEMIAFIADQAIATKILDHLALDATGPPLAAARRATAPDYDVADPVHDA